MTVADFRICFDKETYQPGEMVTGQVVIVITEKAKSLKSIVRSNVKVVY